MPREPRIARQIFVSGRVQGVAFRWSACRAAQELGCDGWVRNLADGRVEAWLEGRPEVVEAMRAWLARGPRLARVDGIDVRDREPSMCSGFDVR